MIRPALVLATTLVAALAISDDWPQFRGPRADGISRETGINKNWSKKPPKQLWKRAMSDQGFACPSVAHGKVFVIDHEGANDIVLALDQKTGNEVWRYAYPDADKVNWGFARATPTVQGGKVYTVSRLGTLHCLDEKTGKPIWSVNVVKDLGGALAQWDMSVSPVIDGQKLLMVTGAKGQPVVALDKDTGKVIWQGGSADVASHSTPVIARIGGKKQYVVFLGTTLQGLDPETGASLWSTRWRSGNLGQPVVIGNAVFVATQYNIGAGLIDVNGDKATERWHSKDFQAHFNTPLLIGRYLYGTRDPGMLSCIDSATGKIMWNQPGFEKGGVVGIDGVMIAMSGSNGDLTMVAPAPSGYKELGKVMGLGGQSWTPPIVANHMLVVRNTKTIACYDLL